MDTTRVSLREIGGDAAGKTENPRDPTELEKLDADLSQSLGRMRDMLGIVETRLDVALGPQPQPASTEPAPSPPARPGSLASLFNVAQALANFCAHLDAQTCRLQRLT